MPLRLARAASLRAGPPAASLAAAAHASGACDAVTSANRLIGLHLRAGRLDAAREVFDGMPRRDVVSWNSLMAAHARSAAHDKVATAFVEMSRRGFRPDHASFSTVLSACARMEALELGRCVHGLAVKTSSSRNVFVGASLITMYANCGVFSCLKRLVQGVENPNVALWNALISGLVMNHRVQDARRVFNRMTDRNVVSWTAMIKGHITVHELALAFELFNLMPAKNSVSWCVMIGGFVNHERFREAIELFNTLMRNGEEMTSAILVKMVNAYAGLKSIGGGRCVHGFAVKSGFLLHHIIEASLVAMYCDSSDLHEARLEFDKMERKQLGSWNSIISGYIHADKIDEARKLFDSMNDRDRISWNLMINGYIKDGKIADATELYSKMPERNVEAATALMSCFIDNGMLEKAQDVFYNMPQVDVVSCTTLLFGYVKGGYMDDAVELFHRMHKRTVITYNVMIAGLLQQGKVTEAYKLFNESPTRDSVSWSCLITGLAQNGLNNDALNLYKKMLLLSNIRPIDSILSSLIGCFSHHSMMFHGQQFHATTIRLGFGSHLLIQNSLISIYCKCGEVIIAQAIFYLMAQRDVVTWNTMIHGYALNSLGQNAIEAFENMKKAQVDPDDITFLGVLSACNHMSLLEEGKHFFSLMCDYGILPNIMHYACMVDLLCRRGMLEQAEELVKSMPFEPDSAIWTSLLSSCRLNGNGRLAEHSASQLISINPTTKMPYLHLIGVNGSTNKWSVIDNLRSQIRNAATEKEVGYSWI